MVRGGAELQDLFGTSRAFCEVPGGLENRCPRRAHGLRACGAERSAEKPQAAPARAEHAGRARRPRARGPLRAPPAAPQRWAHRAAACLGAAPWFRGRSHTGGSSCACAMLERPHRTLPHTGPEAAKTVQVSTARGENVAERHAHLGHPSDARRHHQQPSAGGLHNRHAECLGERCIDKDLHSGLAVVRQRLGGNCARCSPKKAAPILPRVGSAGCPAAALPLQRPPRPPKTEPGRPVLRDRTRPPSPATWPCSSTSRARSWGTAPSSDTRPSSPARRTTSSSSRRLGPSPPGGLAAGVSRLGCVRVPRTSASCVVGDEDGRVRGGRALWLCAAPCCWWGGSCSTRHGPAVLAPPARRRFPRAPAALEHTRRPLTYHKPHVGVAGADLRDHQGQQVNALSVDEAAQGHNGQRRAYTRCAAAVGAPAAADRQTGAVGLSAGRLPFPRELNAAASEPPSQPRAAARRGTIATSALDLRRCRLDLLRPFLWRGNAQAGCQLGHLRRVVGRLKVARINSFVGGEAAGAQDGLRRGGGSGKRVPV